MCGRFSLTQTAEEIAQKFQLGEIPEGVREPRYNIAPTQLVATITEKPEKTGRKLLWMRWGLIPNWRRPNQAADWFPTGEHGAIFPPNG